MKWVLNILGVLLFLAGTVWILQGTGVFPVGGWRIKRNGLMQASY